ncbi:MAG: fimbrillin family protein [Bacteroides sp.]|nr:fimbrillin family protein [Bacteroides sp.]
MYLVSVSSGTYSAQNNVEYAATTTAGVTTWKAAGKPILLEPEVKSAQFCVYYPYDSSLGTGDPSLKLPLHSGEYTGDGDPNDLLVGIPFPTGDSPHNITVELSHAMFMLKLDFTASQYAGKRITNISVENANLITSGTLAVSSASSTRPVAAADNTNKLSYSPNKGAGLTLDATTGIASSSMLLVPFTNSTHTAIRITFTLDGTVFATSIPYSSLQSLKGNYVYTVNINVAQSSAQVTGVQKQPWTEVAIPGGELVSTRRKYFEIQSPTTGGTLYVAPADLIATPRKDADGTITNYDYRFADSQAYGTFAIEKLTAFSYGAYKTDPTQYYDNYFYIKGNMGMTEGTYDAKKDPCTKVADCWRMMKEEDVTNYFAATSPEPVSTLKSTIRTTAGMIWKRVPIKHKDETAATEALQGAVYVPEDMTEEEILAQCDNYICLAQSGSLRVATITDEKRLFFRIQTTKYWVVNNNSFKEFHNTKADPDYYDNGEETKGDSYGPYLRTISINYTNIDSDSEIGMPIRCVSNTEPGK